MDCFKKCLVPDSCKTIGYCAAKHRLFNGCSNSVYDQLKNQEKNKRERLLIDLLQLRQPPKVSGRQVDRYYCLRKYRGIDLDKDEVTKEEIEFHASFNKKKRPKEYKVKKLKQRSVISEQIKKKESKTQDVEYIKYLQHQTPEQFALAKKHGWRVAKMLTEDEPSFHIPSPENPEKRP